MVTNLKSETLGLWRGQLAFRSLSTKPRTAKAASPEFKSPLRCLRIRILELPSSTRTVDKSCRALFFLCLPYPHSQSPTCRVFHLSLHPGPANRSGQEAVTLTLSWGYYSCPAVFSVTLKEDHRGKDHTVSTCLWSWWVWLGEKEAELRVRSWLGDHGICL